MLFVITGPSGSGKSTILRHLWKDLRNIQFAVSHTTRPRRPSELNGREYYFISPEEFKRMAARRMFLEWAEVHGNLYGTSKKEVGEKSRAGDLVLDIDVQGARALRALRTDAVFVFVLPPRASDLKRRLLERGEDDKQTIRRRLANACREIRDASEADYVVVNDRLNRAVLELEAIVLASRCRVDVRMKEIKSILKSFNPPGR
ncbi:MAG: guanylate kinase [Candidatus Aminicenantes bacterium]|nr:guanylate kinase [Candidatus Aminicenantes bacterium]